VSRTKLAAEAWGALLRAHASLVPRIDQVLTSRADLPLRWYDVLLELADTGGHRLTMGELADRVVLSRTRVSRVVDELAVRGLVRRETHERDRRSAYAVLTPLGRTRFDRAAPVYRRAIVEEFAAALTEDELRTLRDALDRTIRGADADTRPGAIRAASSDR
jgi:DNA-binding MarR family transcriptional regulator